MHDNEQHVAAQQAQLSRSSQLGPAQSVVSRQSRNMLVPLSGRFGSFVSLTCTHARPNELPTTRPHACSRALSRDVADIASRPAWLTLHLPAMVDGSARANHVVYIQRACAKSIASQSEDPMSPRIYAYGRSGTAVVPAKSGGQSYTAARYGPQHDGCAFISAGQKRPAIQP